MTGMPDKRFSLIAADPPWHFRTYSEKNQTRAAKVHYDVMDLDGIKSLPVADVAADNCALLLWAVNPMIPQALDVIEAWGFKFKTVAFTWAKTTKRSSTWLPKYHMGLGYWTRANTETCFLAVRGRPKRLAKDVRQLIVAPVRQHSRKPDEFYERAERLLPGPRLELFSRETRYGWEAFGNETGKFDSILEANQCSS